MQEIGTWTTSEGTVSATLQLESEIGDDGTGQEFPKWASGALSGALGGAATGAAAGPWGALIGAGVGATVGGITAASQPAPPKPPAPAKPGSVPTTVTAPPRPPAGAVGGAQAGAIQALQQFAAAVPALIQLVAASRATGAKPSESWTPDEASEFVPGEESLGADEWASYSDFEGAWTIHD